MQVEYERCCGIDVHKDTVVACVIVSDADGKPGAVTGASTAAAVVAAGTQPTEAA